MDKWFKEDKPASKCILPNLPMIEDGDVIITETDAITRHIARRYKPELLGKDAKEQGDVDMYISFIRNFNLKMRMMCYGKDVTEDMRKDMIVNEDVTFSKIDKHAEGKKFLLGDNLTLADIWFYETLQAMKMVHGESC
jgi:glutathione S-transferase